MKVKTAEDKDAVRVQSAAERPVGVAGDARAPRRRGRGDRLRLCGDQRSHRRADRHPRALSLFGERRVPRGLTRRAPRAADGDRLSGRQDLEVKFLTSVMVVPHRPAVLTAKILATIDVMSGGRLIVGVGAGWLEEEFVAIGAPPFAERGTATDEYLMAFRELWTKDKPRFDGRFVKFSDILFAPKPVQKPCPALWIGGESGSAMRRVARIGDGWYPIGANPQHRLDTMARYRAAVERLRKLAADVGRDPASVALAFRVHRHGASAPAK